MHFGRVEDIENIEFHLPADPVRTQKFLTLSWQGQQHLHVACPIWSCKDWVGSVYPPITQPRDFLSIYAQKFSAIELNSTFYGIPKTEQVTQWVQKVEKDFRFCPKVTRTVTENLSRGSWRQDWHRYCHATANFRENLGLCFAQLPESFGPSSLASLKAWFMQKPKDMPLALEFRHPEWFDNHKLIDPAIDLLYRHAVSTVITATPGRLDVRHLSLTQPKVMIRFNGHRLHPTDHMRLQAWAKKVTTWRERGLDEIYFCIHQPGETLIPATVNHFIAMLHEHGNTDIQPWPVERPAPVQPDLFATENAPEIDLI